MEDSMLLRWEVDSLLSLNISEVFRETSVALLLMTGRYFTISYLPYIAVDEICCNLPSVSFSLA
jgi:hypothetical protein